jgi:large subunit ribosomal protein L6
MEQNTIIETISVPEGVTATVQALQVTVTAKNEQSRTFSARGVSIKQENNSIVISGKPANKGVYAIVRSIKAHVNNMIAGSQSGYTAKMAVVFSHFPIKMEVKGNLVEIYNFTGEKKPRIARIVGETKVDVKGKDVTITGTNKEDVGQTCGNIEGITHVRGKDRRIYQDGIYIVTKPQLIEATE